MAYLDPVSFKRKSIVNLCWTVTIILHELSWYVAHPIYTIRLATLRSYRMGDYLAWGGGGMTYFVTPARSPRKNPSNDNLHDLYYKKMYYNHVRCSLYIRKSYDTYNTYCTTLCMLYMYVCGPLPAITHLPGKIWRNRANAKLQPVRSSRGARSNRPVTCLLLFHVESLFHQGYPTDGRLLTGYPDIWIMLKIYSEVRLTRSSTCL